MSDYEHGPEAEQAYWDAMQSDHDEQRVRQHIYALERELVALRAERDELRESLREACRRLDGAIAERDELMAEAEMADDARGAAEMGRDELKERCEALERDVSDAAGELLVDIPEPGSQASKMLLGNTAMRRERDAALEELAECKELLGEVGEHFQSEIRSAGPWSQYGPPPDLATRIASKLNKA